MLIDSHCHLDATEFDTDRETVIQRAFENGVGGIVIPAVDIHNLDKVSALANAWPGCCYAYGIHPLCVSSAREDDIAVLRQYLQKGGAQAVGEIGLDGFIANPDWQRQEWFFVEQLKLAREFDLPVVVHVRRSQDRVLKYLRRYRGVTGIAHAFNGSMQQAQAFIDLGFKLGFGGAMTYDGSLRIRKLAAELPLEVIVLETDSPDIPPAWLDRGRNEPAQLPQIAEVLAKLRNISVAEVSEVTTKNAQSVLRWNCPSVQYNIAH